MSYRLPSHLHRNRHGILYFRIAVPNFARQSLPQKEIYRSLRTTSVREAKQIASQLNFELGAFFGELRMSMVSECDVAVRQINSQRLADIVSYARKWIRQEERYEQLERDLEASQARLRGVSLFLARVEDAKGLRFGDTLSPGSPRKNAF